MCWGDDIARPRYAKAGRPVKNPFPSDEVEKDFAVRGRKMIEQYYDPKLGPKKSFDFGGGKQLSKSAFWAIIFIYYKEKKRLEDNLQGFINIIVKYFGSEVACDRISIRKHMGKITSLEAHHRSSEYADRPAAQEKDYRKHRAQYKLVTTLWEE